MMVCFGSRMIITSLSESSLLSFQKSEVLGTLTMLPCARNELSPNGLITRNMM